MSRLARKNRTNKDIGYKSSGGLLDLFDNLVKETYRINDDEYDYIAENASNDELDLFMKEFPDFALKRKIIITLNKYLNQYEIHNCK